MSARKYGSRGMKNGHKDYPRPGEYYFLDFFLWSPPMDSEFMQPGSRATRELSALDFHFMVDRKITVPGKACTEIANAISTKKSSISEFPNAIFWFNAIHYAMLAIQISVRNLPVGFEIQLFNWSTKMFSARSPSIFR